MSDTSDLYDDSPEGIVLRVHVQPGAGRSAVVGRHGDALKVRVAAPPVDGRANEATRALLAEALGLPEADVELTAGPSSRVHAPRAGACSCAVTTATALPITCRTCGRWRARLCPS